MSKNLKAMLFSENGMKIVNTLFLITAFCGGGVLTILTYSLWLFFLAGSVKRTESKAMRVFYVLLAFFCGGGGGVAAGLAGDGVVSNLRKS